MRDIPGTLRRGFEFIETQQLLDGSFLSLSSPDPLHFGPTAPEHRTTFIVATILNCLNALPNSRRKLRLSKKAINFLLTQRSDAWSWNYWQRGSPEQKAMPYPDDLDDTICSAIAAASVSESYMDGTAVSNILRLLRHVEVKPGGPYKTWLVSPDADKSWKDVDVVVNSNIAYFLSLYQVRLCPLSDFLESAIHTCAYTSPYYPSWHAGVYALSRGYQGPLKQKVIDFIHEHCLPNGTYGNVLETVLATSALLRLGAPLATVSRSIAYLLRSKKGDAWEAAGFCIDAPYNGAKQFAGAPALTTALCLETLALYAYELEQSTLHYGQTRFSQAVQQRINQRIAALPVLLRDVFKKRFLSLLHKDVYIVLLPWLFVRDLKKELSGRIPYKVIVELAVANAFGWFAYSLLDDMLDGDITAERLPVLCVALREVTALFMGIAHTWPIHDTPTFAQLFRRIMDTLDEANLWEQQCQRVPIRDGLIEPSQHTYMKLDIIRSGQRSLGHALAPLGVLSMLGFGVSSQESKYVLRFFKHYLTLRQLHDDAHDWKTDLEAGRLTPVVQLVCKLYTLSGHTGPICIDKDIHMLQRLFWQTGIKKVVDMGTFHAQKARDGLKGLTILKPQNCLMQLVVSLERSILKAERESANAAKFISVYMRTDL